MLAKYYSLALALALAGKTGQELEDTLVRFFSLIKEKGHLALLPHILRELDRYASLLSARESVTITTPAPASPEQVANIKKEFREYGIGEAELVQNLDTFLIGGFTLRTKDMRIDASYRNQLLRLYQQSLNRQ